MYSSRTEVCPSIRGGKTFLKVVERVIRIGLLLLIVATLAGRAGRADDSVKIDPRTTWGAWEGWGVSLCWWAKAFGSRDDLADILFTTNHTSLNGALLPGLGLNIARYNAGACSQVPVGSETMQESPNVYASRQMEGFWLDWYSEDPTSSSWDWSVDANQRSMLLKARDRGADLLELFSNSPMWWMCYNHNPSGADNGGDNLQWWDYGRHAIYLAAIAEKARDSWGITFDSVEPFNEPSASWWTSNGTQEGCHFDRSTQAGIIDLLRDELDSRGLGSVIVAASDETSYDSARDTWNSFSAATRAEVGRVNVHGYQYGGGRRDLLYNDVSADGKRVWNTEYGDSDASGVSLARNLYLDFRWLRQTAWCYWQPLDWAGWGLIDANLEIGSIGQPERKYYVLAHFTRHIRPGMTIVDGYQAGSGVGYDTVAAYDAANRKLVLVTMNYDIARPITYDLSLFFSATGPVRRWVTETGSSVSYSQFDDTVIMDKTFQSTFPANTIQTFEISNVDIDAPPLKVEAASGGSIRLSWPTAYVGYVLQTTTDLADPASWRAVDVDPVISGEDYQVTLSTAGKSEQFFRLSMPLESKTVTAPDSQDWPAVIRR